MQSEQWVAVAATAVAVCALLGVLVLALALRRTRADVRTLLQPARSEPTVSATPVAAVATTPAPVVPRPLHRPEDLEDLDDAVVITSDGRTLVLPSTEQVVNATMSRPMIRGAVLSHGVLHALRPQSRDRILAMIRRDYRARRKTRLRAGRNAARATPVGRVQAQAWLGSDIDGTSR